MGSSRKIEEASLDGESSHILVQRQIPKWHSTNTHLENTNTKAWVSSRQMEEAPLDQEPSHIKVEDTNTLITNTEKNTNTKHWAVAGK